MPFAISIPRSEESGCSTTRRAGAILLLLLATPCAIGASTLEPQSAQAQDEPAAVTLDIGMGQGTPGASVLIPATLKISDNTEVGAIGIEVVFPNNLVTFQEVRKAIGAEAANAEVTATVESVEEDPEHSVAIISVTSEQGMWIPGSTVVELVFKVEEEALVHAVATLEPRFRATTAGESPSPILPTAVDSGVIFVGETTLIFSCLFYMH